MEELKRHKLRTEYGNITGDKIRTEHYVTYNHDYVKWLEDELLKLLNIADVRFREARAEVCGKNDYWRTCDTWVNERRCLKNCPYHKQT